MWWSRAILFVALLALGPMGCGFRPLYGQPDPTERAAVLGDMAQVGIGPIRDHVGQQMRNALLTRITPDGEPASPKYRLSVELSLTSGATGFRKDALATLGEMGLAANCQLLLGETVHSFTSRTRVSFDLLGPRYASVAMERDAEQRAVEQVADEIANQVALVLSGRLKPSSTLPENRP